VLENLGDAAEPAAAGAEARTDRVIDFSPRARRRGWGYAVAALAAAACVTFVAVQVIQRPLRKPAGAGLAAQPATNPAPQALALAAANGPVRIDAPAYQDRGLPTTAFVTRRLALGSPGSQLAAASPVMVSAASDGTLLPPMPLVSAGENPLRPSIEQFVFQTSATPADSPRVYRGRRSSDSDIERTAYQFKR
jgi:hypothetical protein